MNTAITKTISAGPGASFVKSNVQQLPSKDQFEIHRISELKLFPFGSNESRSFCEILFVTHGSGILQTDSSKHSVNKGNAYLLTMEQAIDLEGVNGLEGYFIKLPASYFSWAGAEFNTILMTSYGNGFQQPMVIPFSDELQKEMEEVLCKMYSEFVQFNLFRAEILAGFFRIFILYLSRNVRSLPSTGSYSRDIDVMNRFAKLVAINYSTEKTVSFYADALCLTPNYLNQVIKRTSGFTASYWIQQYIVTEAKRRASDCRRSMKEIAYDLGFIDVSHFSKFFKTFSGINFSSFKKLTLSA